MPSDDWKLWEGSRLRHHRAMIATIKVHAHGRRYLRIGQVLLDEGFDPKLAYNIYFNEALFAMRLKLVKRGRKFTKNSPRLDVTAFCEQFGLPESYEAKSFKQEDDMWTLILEPIKNLSS